jgi:uncharacterized protein (TIGR03086 family)
MIAVDRQAERVTDCFTDIRARFERASAGFARLLRGVGPAQWDQRTPCPEWTVRNLVNHMAAGNLNYVGLVHGATAAEFLARRDTDVLGTDPVGVFAGSVRACAAAFAEPGALDRLVDYPFGTVTGRQALAVRTADSVIHTWDLARAIGADERLDPELVAWLDDHVAEIYAGLPEMPVSARTTNGFFAPARMPGADATQQDRLLLLMGRTP